MPLRRLRWAVVSYYKLGTKVVRSKGGGGGSGSSNSHLTIDVSLEDGQEEEEIHDSKLGTSTIQLQSLNKRTVVFSFELLAILLIEYGGSKGSWLTWENNALNQPTCNQAQTEIKCGDSSIRQMAKMRLEKEILTTVDAGSSKGA